MSRAMILLLCVGLNACVTPVIPLPPPGIEDLTLSISGSAPDMVTLSGKPNLTYRGYYHSFLNLRTGRGQIVRASPDDGRFETDPFSAQDNDQLNLWTSRTPDEATSDVLCVELRFATRTLRKCP